MSARNTDRNSPTFTESGSSRKTPAPVRLKADFHYHFLGVGGIGMSALAATMKEWGYQVSGSDARESETLDTLAAAGIPVSIGHDPASLRNADAVVYSTAIGKANPIWREVDRLNLECYHRAEILGALAAERRSLAVTGTHGKTTTSAALAVGLIKAGWDPTVIVGGHVAQLNGSNQRSGAGPWLVCEADESDGSFVHLSPEAVLLTNVEEDHLDYHGSLGNLMEAFRRFLDRLKPEGLLVYCCDDPLADQLGRQWPGRSITYGLSESAECRVHLSRQKASGMDLELHMGNRVQKLSSPLGGQQNALNLAGVYALGMGLGVPEAPLLEGLSEFQGVARRQQYLGELGDLKLFDDYAHHPTEIKVTLEQFLATHGEPLMVVFQPHLYSRTLHFADEFAQALRLATHVFVTEIYGAREQPVAGVSGRMIVERMRDHPSVHFLPDWEEMIRLVKNDILPPGVLLTLGAGDITRLGPALLKELGTGKEGEKE